MSQAFTRRPFPYGGGPDGSDIDWVRLHRARAELEQVQRRQAQARAAQMGQAPLPTGGLGPAGSDVGPAFAWRTPPGGHGQERNLPPSVPAPLSVPSPFARARMGAAAIEPEAASQAYRLPLGGLPAGAPPPGGFAERRAPPEALPLRRGVSTPRASRSLMTEARADAERPKSLAGRIWDAVTPELDWRGPLGEPGERAMRGMQGFVFGHDFGPQRAAERPPSSATGGRSAPNRPPSQPSSAGRTEVVSPRAPAAAKGAVTSTTYTEADVDLLTRMMVTEAIGEGELGMAAVGHVALNRLKRPKRFGATLAEVLDPEEFDGLRRADGVKPEDYKRARAVAIGVLSGKVPDPTQGATHHYNPKKVTPFWADGRAGLDIGNHRFMRGVP